jgi:hypothetical protein
VRANDKHRISRENPDRSHLRDGECLRRPKKEIVSFGTILINISQYGPENTGPWLMHAVCILFWIDVRANDEHRISRENPDRSHLRDGECLRRPKKEVYIIGGTTIQGVGFLVSLMVYSAFIYRLMTQKLPRDNTSPASAPLPIKSAGNDLFAPAAIVTSPATVNPADFMGNGALAGDVLRIVVNFACLWLWG